MHKRAGFIDLLWYETLIRTGGLLMKFEPTFFEMLKYALNSLLNCVKGVLHPPPGAVSLSFTRSTVSLHFLHYFPHTSQRTPRTRPFPPNNHPQSTTKSLWLYWLTSWPHSACHFLPAQNNIRNTLSKISHRQSQQAPQDKKSDRCSLW